jgi:RNA polymerase sigma-70 factor (ECF subfamily)
MNVSTGELEDWELVERFKRTGDQRYFMLLFERYQKLIYSIGHAMLGDCGLAEDAEDVVQETFMRAYRQVNLRDDIKPDFNFKAWFSAIARNFCLDLWRKRRPVDTADVLDQVVDPSPSPDDSALGQKLLVEINALEKNTKRCVLLVWIDGYSYKETARIMGCTVRRVKNDLRVAQRTLRARLT